MADFDAIIVGSGHNGLVCALALARRGWKVLVLERNAQFGGGLRTEEITLPGFRHDLFATNIGHFMGSPAAREFHSDFERTTLRIIANEHAYASVYGPSNALRVYRDVERTEQEIRKISPNEASNWREVVQLFQRSAKYFLPLNFTELPSAEMARHIWTLVKSRPIDALRLARIVSQSSSQFVDVRFQSAEVKGLFTPWSFHLDFSPDVPGGATFAFISALSSHLNGLAIAENGASELARALKQSIDFHGGVVRCNEEVLSIKVRDNRAALVQTSNGHEISAGRAIVANVTPRLLFGKLIDAEQLPSRFLTKMSNFRHAVGTFVVHLALSAPLDWTAADDLAEFGYIHVNGTAQDIKRTYHQASNGLLPDRPMLIVSQTSNVDPTRAPPGRTILRFHARAFPAQIRGDAAGTIEGRNWDAVKEQVADRLIDLLAEHAPNVKRVTMARHIVSPLDLERINPNLIGGDCNGGSHQLDQNFFFRPAFGWSRYRTPIDGLYMIGASQWPGGGVNGASGYAVAKQLGALYLEG
jgi:phytoene dehydrogenase-like protein